MAWVTDSPTWVNSGHSRSSIASCHPCKVRSASEPNLNKWTREDLDEAGKMVAAYKSIRETVQRGSLYRLISPENNSEQSVTETVSRDGRQAVAFAFLHSSRELIHFHSFISAAWKKMQATPSP